MSRFHFMHPIQTEPPRRQNQFGWLLSQHVTGKCFGRSRSTSCILTHYDLWAGQMSIACQCPSLQQSAYNMLKLKNTEYSSCACRFAKEHEGEYDWVRKNEGHKGVQVQKVWLQVIDDFNSWSTVTSLVATLTLTWMQLSCNSMHSACGCQCSIHQVFTLHFGTV